MSITSTSSTVRNRGLFAERQSSQADLDQWTDPTFAISHGPLEDLLLQAANDPKAPKWSAEVTRKSNSLDLEPGVFTQSDPKLIAASLKRSAQASRRRKAAPFASAMSMLNFYINRAGTNLPSERRRILEAAKHELRRQFGR